MLIAGGLVFVSVLQYTKKIPQHTATVVSKKQEYVKEGEPAFTLEEAEIFLKEMTPLVEKATGKKFTEIPKVKIIDRDGLEKIIVRDLIPQLMNLMKDLMLLSCLCSFRI